MKNYYTLLTAFVLILSGCKNEPEEKHSEPEKEPTVVEKIANANGLENFDNITELKYTFNVKVNDSLRTSRAWTWEPKTNTVTLTTPDSTVTYNHKSEAAAHEWVDQRFINDQYWLLFPFHLVWDEMKWQHEEEATAPISGETMERVIVTYPAGAGYTPGDVYEVYFDDDHIIKEWVYKSGGSEENPFAATWEEYEDLKGVKIATRHRNEDGSFELFFDGIEIKTE
ncbi:hypothetical protein SAMN04488034_11327 [Salinimicrobium catena]|uniref:Uncharacterized protein n=1 Tax=Salinimicrobium catena TaxID=390640 RepID=A0A1H5PE06_9FLAO|nr:hypothetical protein [Salinimicrobium catena]SDL81422.1 hypothetical protein SAMN04488140_11327 [Salinimicrobium catena]SEF12192.1 hypothetical protein SAMN04488034_11327 [Salinimicrobium catena]